MNRFSTKTLPSGKQLRARADQVPRIAPAPAKYRGTVLTPSETGFLDLKASVLCPSGATLGSTCQTHVHACMPTSGPTERISGNEKGVPSVPATLSLIFQAEAFLVLVWPQFTAGAGDMVVLAALGSLAKTQCHFLLTRCASPITA